MEKKNWQHVVQYYETDQMQIVHHSNYIRWFEEARTWMLEEAGFSYKRMEEEGIIIPVLGVSAEYKKMVRFGETVEIIATASHFSGVKMTLSYEVRDVKTKEVKAIGETKHAFLDLKTYRPVSLKRKHPELFKLFNGFLEEKMEESN